jgi:hypothetical protein
MQAERKENVAGGESYIKADSPRMDPGLSDVVFRQAKQKQNCSGGAFSFNGGQSAPILRIVRTCRPPPVKESYPLTPLLTFHIPIQNTQKLSSLSPS